MERILCHGSYDSTARTGRALRGAGAIVIEFTRGKGRREQRQMDPQTPH
jgi:hypothetical protein